MKKAQFVRKPENLTEVKEKVKKYGGEIETVEIKCNLNLVTNSWKRLTSNFFQKITHFENFGGVINGKTQVIQVTNTDTNESIFINPEGYDYARYVGIEWNDPRNKG
jgi:bifunctional ADP-heptose synthase (sugar kinase/adenylyltransferase)|tara:strand:+ start:269 stop:589 length:321 start_codon:yes stop_codon:yes gene_type:complete